VGAQLPVTPFPSFARARAPRPWQARRPGQGAAAPSPAHAQGQQAARGARQRCGVPRRAAPRWARGAQSRPRRERRRLRRSGGGGLRRPWGGAEQAPGRPEGPRARGSCAWGGAERAGGVRGRRRRVPRQCGSDSTAAAPIRVRNRSGSRRRPRLSSPWVDFGRRRPRRGSSTKRGGARRERRWRAAV